MEENFKFPFNKILSIILTRSMLTKKIANIYDEHVHDEKDRTGVEVFIEKEREL